MELCTFKLSVWTVIVRLSNHPIHEVYVSFTSPLYNKLAENNHLKKCQPNNVILQYKIYKTAFVLNKPIRIINSDPYPVDLQPHNLNLMSFKPKAPSGEYFTPPNVRSSRSYLLYVAGSWNCDTEILHVDPKVYDTIFWQLYVTRLFSVTLTAANSLWEKRYGCFGMLGFK